MLEEICKILKDKIKPLPFSDRLAGLVREALDRRELSERQEDGTYVVYQIVEKLFPVVMDGYGLDCAEGTYKTLAPDSSKKTVIYFERMSDDVYDGETKQGLMSMQVKGRLVVWVNLQKLGQATDANLTVMQSQLFGLLKTSVTFQVGTQNIKANIAPLSITHDKKIFTKYSYDTAVINNMLLYPYQYFAIDFKAEYMTGSNCFTFTPDSEFC
jgi:hypothetical protein